MSLKQAMGIVYDLAAQNRLEETDGEDVLEREQKRQDEALARLLSFIALLA